MIDKFTDKILELKQKHNVLGVMLFSEFANDHSSLRDFVTSHYKNTYLPDERIVFVQDIPDEYEYTDLPGKLLVLLQKTLSDTDISNSFVHLITPNKEIEQELVAIKNRYTSDPNTFLYSIVQSDMPEKTILHKDSFCIIPWMHLYVGTDGNVLPCCVADQNYPIGNINEYPVDDILQSEQFNQIRKNMLNRTRCKECSHCYVREDNNLDSPRISYNKKYKDIIEKTKFNKDGSLSEVIPIYLDIRLSNVCNLKCRMCSGYFSSSIAQEDAILFNNTIAKESALNLQVRSDNIKQILKYIPHVEKIYFAGGEPLLSSEHYQILESLIEHGKTDVILQYNSNLTTLSYKKINVIDLWKHFKNLRIGASLDAHGSVAEYFRHGSDWSQILENLSNLKQNVKQLDLRITSAVGFYNVENLIEMQKAWHNSQMHELDKFEVNLITSPEHLTVKILPEHHKLRLQHTIQNHIDFCNFNDAKILAKSWRDVLKYMMSEDCSHMISEFKRLTNILDEYRDEDFSKVLPQFKDLLV